jgi:hypothetical protein
MPGQYEEGVAMQPLYLPKRGHHIALGGHPWPKGVPKVSFNKVLKDLGLPPIPDEYDAEVDGCGQEFAGHMWGNDKNGDCEIVSAANWTRIAEYHEQGKEITITDDDVLNWYFTLTGGADSGLDDSTVFAAWQSTGFTVSEPIPSNIARLKALKKHPLLVKALLSCPCHWNPTPTPPTGGENLKIYDFAELQGVDERRCAVALLYGTRLVIQVPQYAIDQFDAGEPWHYDPKGNQTIVGYHSIYGKKYYKVTSTTTPKDIIDQIRTWAATVDVTQDFWDHNLEGAYCVVDDSDAFLQNSPIDRDKLEAEKQAIVGG